MLTWLLLAFLLGVCVGGLIVSGFAVPKMAKLLLKGVRLNKESARIMSDLEEDNKQLREWVAEVLPVIEDAERELRAAK